MIESAFVRDLLGLSLVVLALLSLVIFYRIWQVRTAADRLLAVDVFTSLLINVCIVVALLEGSDNVIDVGIILAALSFAGTLAIARYLAEGKVF